MKEQSSQNADSAETNEDHHGYATAGVGGQGGAGQQLQDSVSQVEVARTNNQTAGRKIHKSEINTKEKDNYLNDGG